MIIGVTSKSQIKIDAVKSSYKTAEIDATVIGYKTSSGIAEQPIGDETLSGAENRINNLSKHELFDRIISIENGLFYEGTWIDRAVIIIYDPKTKRKIIGKTKGVEFPEVYVKKAKQIGFDKITVGQIMEEEGFIKNNKDPHLELSGVSRQKILEEKLEEMVKEFESTIR